MSVRRRIFVIVCIVAAILLIVWVINLFADALGGVEENRNQPAEAAAVLGRVDG